MIKKYIKILLVGLLVLVSRQPLSALRLEIDILNNHYTPYNVSISDFYTTGDTKKYYNDFKKVLLKDLENSGMFKVVSIKENLVSSDVNLLDMELHLGKYLYYEAIILGKFTYDNISLEYILEYMIVDTRSHEIKANYGYRISRNDIKNELEDIAHEIADEYYRVISGKQSYFKSFLVYSEGSKLISADYAGGSKKTLVTSKGRVYGPVVAPKGDMIAYVNFEKGLSSIHLYDLIFKKDIKLGNLQGLSLSPRFSQDAKELLFSVTKDGTANILSMDIATKEITRLTNSYSINLAGGYSKDNQLIVFNSDRTGRPSIYVMNKNGSNVKKISKGEGSYFNPSFSSEADIILFTKVSKGRFYIGLLNLDGKEKIIAEDSLVESPAWLSDGRHIIYQYRYAKDRYSFYIMDIISGFKFKVDPSTNSKDPQLSNNIPLIKKNSVKFILK